MGVSALSQRWRLGAGGNPGDSLESRRVELFLALGEESRRSVDRLTTVEWFSTVVFSVSSSFLSSLLSISSLSLSFRLSPCLILPVFSCWLALGALPALQSVHLVGCVDFSTGFAFQVGIVAIVIVEVVHGGSFLFFWFP